MSWLEPIQKLGFAIIPSMLKPMEVGVLLEAFSQAELPRSRAGLRHAMKLPAVASLAQDPRLMKIARGTLGADAFPFRATLFDKSPTANWLVVWHQDTALPFEERRDIPGWGPWSVKDGVNYAHAPATALSLVLALRVHLDDSTDENGPLRVLPDTHTLGVLTDESLHDLSTRIAAIDCLVPQGGVLAMRPLIVHASSKLQTHARRRVLHIEYASTASVADGLTLAIA